jgi:hypothetical protein
MAITFWRILLGAIDHGIGGKSGIQYPSLLPCKSLVAQEMLDVLLGVPSHNSAADRRSGWRHKFDLLSIRRAWPVLGTRPRTWSAF